MATDAPHLVTCSHEDDGVSLVVHGVCYSCSRHVGLAGLAAIMPTTGARPAAGDSSEPEVEPDDAA
jgi:hypothetical protein